MTDTQPPAIRPSFGVEIDATDPIWQQRDWDTMRSLVHDHGVVVVHGLDMDEEECTQVCRSLGEPVQYTDGEIGYEYDVLVHLKGYGDRVIQGRGSMPLHTDGILGDRRVEIVLLYCAEADGFTGEEGATLVSDQRTALRSLDPAVLETLDRNGLEFLIEERDYFATLPLDWYPRRGTHRFNDELFIHTALPYEEGVTPAWDVRVGGVTQAESDEILAAVKAACMAPEALYAHAWRKGDLVLVNNHSMLHGRNGVAGNRWLMNGQAMVPSWSYS